MLLSQIFNFFYIGVGILTYFPFATIYKTHDTIDIMSLHDQKAK